MAARFCLVFPPGAHHRQTQVVQLEERLLADVKAMKETFGPEAMILSLALAQVRPATPDASRPAVPS